MEIVSRLLPYAQIALSVLLIVTILLQQSGAGFDGAFGGGDSSVTYHTRRGFEKFLYYFAMVLGVLFAASALAALFLK